MAASLWYSTLVVVTCTMVSACASDSPPDRQRPAYSFENVDMGTNQSMQPHRVDEPPPPQQIDPYSGGYRR